MTGISSSTKFPIKIDQTTRQIGIILPGNSHALSKKEINKKISKTEAYIQQFSLTKCNRKIDGGKAFRAKQIAKKDLLFQIKEKLDLLIAAKRKIEEEEQRRKQNLLESLKEYKKLTVYLDTIPPVLAKNSFMETAQIRTPIPYE